MGELGYKEFIKTNQPDQYRMVEEYESDLIDAALKIFGEDEMKDLSSSKDGRDMLNLLGINHKELNAQLQLG